MPCNACYARLFLANWYATYMHFYVGKLICNLYALLCWQKNYYCKKAGVTPVVGRAPSSAYSARNATRPSPMPFVWQGVLFCSPTVAEMVHKRPVVGTRFGWWWVTVKVTSGEAPSPRSSPTCSSWPRLASRPVQWLQSVTKSSNLVAARVQRVSSLAGENLCYLVHYL
jgi:hypothetical protein